jgi:RHS repeat-associated protein
VFQTGRRFEAIVSLVPLHFADASGKWTDIDNTLVASPRPAYGARNKANSWTVDLPQSLTDPVIISSPDGPLGIRATRATGRGVVKGLLDEYRGAWPGVTIVYQPTATGLKESLVLDSISASAGKFRFDLSLPAGSRATQLQSGEIDILDQTGKILFEIPKGYMRDSRFESAGATDTLSWKVTTTLGRDSSGTYIQIEPDQAWLSQPYRTWPVTIDPSVTVRPNPNCTVITSPYTSTCSNDILQVGYYNNSVSRALLQFPNPGLERVATVLNSTVALYLTYAAPTSQSIEMHSMSRAWTNQATWATYDGTRAWTNAGGDFAAASEWTTNGFTTVNSWYQWYPTNLSQGWLNGTSSNYGVILKASNETSSGTAVTFASTFNTNQSALPYLKINFAVNVGSAADYGVDSYRITDRLILQANIGDGNQFLQLHNFGVRGVGLNLSVNSFFNGFVGSAPDLGTGWSLGLGYDVWLDSWSFPDGAIFYSPSGKVFRFATNGSNFTSPPGINATLANASGGAHTLTYNSSAEVLTFDSNGYFTKDADRNGNAMTFRYDTNGALASLTDTEGRVTTFASTPTGKCGWTASGLITTITDSANRQYKYTYNAATCALLSYSDPQNGIAKPLNFQWQANGNLDRIVDNNGNATKFTYLSTPTSGWLGSVGRVYNPLGDAFTTTYSYGVVPNNSPAGTNTVTDANAHQTQYAFDNQGRLTKVTDAYGHQRQTSWNPNNNVTSLTDALSAVSTLTYDTNNNLTMIQAPASASGQTAATTSFGYRSPGQAFLPSSRTDTQGNCRAFTYDSNGNLTNVYDGQASGCDGMTGGIISCNAYQGDPAGTCGATTTVSCTNAVAGEPCWTKDGRSNQTTYAYDSSHNLATVTPPSPLGPTTIVSDSVSRPASTTDGKGQKTTYTYDALDRITQILYGGATSCSSGSTCTTFSYDSNGNLTSRTNATGTTSFIYDALNRLTRKTLPSASWNCSGQTGMTFGYDPVGNLTSYCDAGGSLAYSYDLVNRVQNMAEPSGTCSGTPSLCSTFAYDNNDRLTTLTFPGGATQNLSYDGAGNLTTAVGKDSAAAVLTSFSYTYAQGTQDKRVRLSMTEADPLANLTTSYTYDAFGRLIKASNTQITLNYAYDAAGNRCSTGTTCDGTWTYNAANELTASPGVTSYSYDTNGNLTGSSTGGSFTYNSQNQTTAATWNAQTIPGMAYADLGQAERTAAGSTTYASSPLGLQIANTASSNTFFLRDGKGNLLGQRLPDASRWYYLRDGLGSIVAVINGNGSTVANRYAYDPYGKVTTSTGTQSNPWGYAGGLLDSTGLVKFGTRYYDPNIGRWTQQDPMGGRIASPNSLNRYPYALDDPMNRTDPSGRCTSPWECAAGILGLFAGFDVIGLGAAVAIYGAPTLLAIPLGVIIIIGGVIVVYKSWQLIQA